jgi:hypothetical protein
VRSDENASWFGHFVSAIVLAVGLRPIEHMDSGVRFRASEEFLAKVVVFTDKTIIFADASGPAGNSDKVEMAVVAHPRAGLAQLSITDAASAFERDAFDPWPGDFKVTAEWAHGTKVTFPLGPIELEEQRARFVDLYAALSAALGE